MFPDEMSSMYPAENAEEESITPDTSLGLQRSVGLHLVAQRARVGITPNGIRIYARVRMAVSTSLRGAGPGDGEKIC